MAEAKYTIGNRRHKESSVMTLRCPSCPIVFQRAKWEVARSAINACSQRCAFAERKRTTENMHREKGMKICPQCKQAKMLNDFHRAKRERSGHVSYCKKCQSRKSKKYKTDGNRRRAQVKAALVIRLGNRCAKCGIENLPICCYQFHHRNGDTKDFAISMFLTQRAWDIEAELAKCELLCSYCHALEHALYSNRPATSY